MCRRSTGKLFLFQKIEQQEGSGKTPPTQLHPQTPLLRSRVERRILNRDELREWKLLVPLTKAQFGPFASYGSVHTPCLSVCLSTLLALS